MKVFVWAPAILIAGLALAGCSGGSDGGGTTNPSPAGAVTITILGQNGNSSFSPNPASAGGKVVVFKNNDSVTHHVVLNDGSVDTGDIAPGATSKQVTMPANGANYHCSIHANMGGAIAAESGGAPPACTDPIYCY